MILFKDDEFTLVRLDARREAGRTILQKGHYIFNNNRWYQWVGGGVRRMRWVDQVRILESEVFDAEK